MRAAQEAASGLRLRDVAEVEHHLDVVDAHVAERALVQAGRPDRSHQRRVAAETAAVNADAILVRVALFRSEEHTSELQSLMRNSSAVFCLKKQNSAKLSTKKNYKIM